MNELNKNLSNIFDVTPIEGIRSEKPDISSDDG